MITARNLRVEQDHRQILTDVSITIRPGEIVGLIGPPESGKTTLVKALATLIPLKSGHLLWNEKPIIDERERAEWRRRLGMAFQNNALFDALTVYENVAFPLRRRRLQEADIDHEVLRRLNDVGLLDARHKLPAALSGGMKKRVGIARAMVLEPVGAFFDEPTAGLDPETATAILDLLVTFAKTQRVATVVISSDLVTLLPICDSVVMLHQGRVVFDGDIEALHNTKEPLVRQFVTGSNDGPL